MTLVSPTEVGLTNESVNQENQIYPFGTTKVASMSRNTCVVDTPSTTAKDHGDLQKVHAGTVIPAQLTLDSFASYLANWRFSKCLLSYERVLGL